MPRMSGMLVQEKPGSSIHSGRQWVRVANIAIPLSTDPPGTTVIPVGCRAVLITANSTNAGIVVLGNAGVTAVPEIGTPLVAGEKVAFEIDDISKLFLNGANVGDAVAWNTLR